MERIHRFAVLSSTVLALASAGCSSKWTAQDADGDGYTVSDGDCWDKGTGPEGSDLGGADIYPGATESWYDGFDQDCGDDDDYDADADGYVRDQDQGLGTYGVLDSGALPGGDCWDDPGQLPDGWIQVDGTAPVSAAQSWPGAPDSWYDGIDQDCGSDGDFDADLDGHDSADDPQGDGSVGGDCDDGDAAVNPDAAELCDDLDNDCDALVDSADSDVDPSSIRTWYGDGDGDEYGADADLLQACDQPEGYVETAGDCQDEDPDVNPAADELCNDVDDDCNGSTDEAAADAPTWYADGDSDGYGDEADAVAACDQPGGYVADDTDCDDDDDAISPGDRERCSTAGVDDDCDGSTDETDAVDATTWYSDLDGDGYGVLTLSTQACDEPVAFSERAGDCDDAEYTVNPAADELCSTVGVDDDCDDQVDEDDAIDGGTFYRDDDGDGYGSGFSTTTACTTPEGYADNAEDCDDDCDSCWNDAEEICNDGNDNDCDGTPNDCSTIEPEVDLGAVEVAILGMSNEDKAGRSIASGDLDGDGQVDLIIGAVGAGDGGTTYVVQGPVDTATDVSTATLVVTGVASDDKAGRSVALVDIDGDGYDDALFSAPDTDADGTHRGAAYVFYGPSAGTSDASAADWIIQGAGNGDYLGRLVAGVGDLDEDGVADFAVSGVYVDRESGNDGAVLVLTTDETGSSTGEAVATAIIYGDSSEDRLGSAMDAAGDVDGDGVDDLVLGALRDDTAASNAGAAFLFLGPVAGEASSADADATWTGEEADDYAGDWVSGGGDVDGDGRPDLVVGAYNQGGDGYGAAYLVSGSATPTGGSLGDAAAIVRGTTTAQQMGVSADLVADMDGDGRAELALGDGERDDCTSSSPAGNAYIFLGGLSGSLDAADADVVMSGGDTGDCAGAAVLDVGDLSGDGARDLAVGAPGDDSRTGAVLVVQGGGI